MTLGADFATPHHQQLIPVLRALDRQSFERWLHSRLCLLLPVLILDQSTTSSGVHAIPQDPQAAVIRCQWRFVERDFCLQRQDRETDTAGP